MCLQPRTDVPRDFLLRIVGASSQDLWWESRITKYSRGELQGVKIYCGDGVPGAEGRRVPAIALTIPPVFSRWNFAKFHLENKAVLYFQIQFYIFEVGVASRLRRELED